MAERLISKKDLCAKIKMSDSVLRKYISRNGIIQYKKGFVDLDNETNKVCIIEYALKKGVDAESLLYNYDDVVDSKIEDHEKEVKQDRKKPKTYSELQVIKTSKEIDKIDIDTKLRKLEHEKKKAKVLPLDFVTEWSARNIRGIFGETVNFGNSIIESICNDLDADLETKLKFKKLFKQGFNDILKSGIKNQEPEAIAQAKEYSLLTKW